MTEPATSCGSPSTLLETASTAERELHQQLLLDNTEFIIDTLVAEDTQHQRQPPVGCPGASPEVLARRLSGASAPCRYDALQRDSKIEDSAGCPCDDPLLGSDDPLDAVAAAVLAPEVTAPSERFFQRVSRQTVATLREQNGDWDAIATLDRDELHDALQAATSREGVSVDRIARLETLLEAVEETHYTEGVTLCDFSRVHYSTYADFLCALPGISEGDAWWLIQTAFDKPVWPVDSHVDDLLCSLGLLHPEEIATTSARRSGLEEELLDRQIPALYRALATHAVRSGADTCGEGCEVQKFLLSHRLREQQTDREAPTVVDLFSGAGGLSCGLSRAGYDIRWAIDIDADAVATYRLNHPEIPHENVVCGDIREIDLVSRIRAAVPNPDLIVGGPPCQSLSKAGYRSRRASDADYSILDDDRTTLYTKYVEAIEDLRPKAIIMENVEGMVSEVGDTGIRVIDWILDDLEELGNSGPGYHVDFRLKDLGELGVPQKRKRVLLVGVRDDIVDGEDQIMDLFETLPSKESPRSIRQGLAGLPRLRRGEGGRVLPELSRGRKSTYVKEHSLHEGTSICYNHRAREHPMKKDRILFDKALQPGDTGWDVKYGSDGKYAEYIEYDVGTAENPRFSDKYRKLEWSEPSPTIVAHLAKDANGYVLPDYYETSLPDPERADPERNRGITPREAARLQSFPDSYVFLGSFTSWFRQIGNAVPPIAGEMLGETLLPLVSGSETSAVRTAEGSEVAESSSDD